MSGPDPSDLVADIRQAKAIVDAAPAYRHDCSNCTPELHVRALADSFFTTHIEPHYLAANLPAADIEAQRLIFGEGYLRGYAAALDAR